MKNSIGAAMLSAVLGLAVAGCSHLPGKPGFRPETMRPSQQHNFEVLYKANCSACHGDAGQNGAAMPLDNPTYLQWAGRDRMIGIVTYGVSGGLMPAFGPGGGGLLTNEQVGNIVDGMISHWGKADALGGDTAPAYSPTTKADAIQGKAAFQTYCARCHGSDGAGVPATNASGAHTEVVGSIVDPTYLSLITNHGLRDIVVSGMPGEHMPDWRNDVAGRPMSDKEITDVVAWLASQRVQFPGQPFSPRKSATPDRNQTAARSQR